MSALDAVTAETKGMMFKAVQAGTDNYSPSDPRDGSPQAFCDPPEDLKARLSEELLTSRPEKDAAYLFGIVHDILDENRYDAYLRSLDLIEDVSGRDLIHGLLVEIEAVRQNDRQPQLSDRVVSNMSNGVIARRDVKKLSVRAELHGRIKQRVNVGQNSTIYETVEGSPERRRPSAAGFYQFNWVQALEQLTEVLKAEVAKILESSSPEQRAVYRARVEQNNFESRAQLTFKEDQERARLEEKAEADARSRDQRVAYVKAHPEKYRKPSPEVKRTAVEVPARVLTAEEQARVADLNSDISWDTKAKIQAFALAKDLPRGSRVRNKALKTAWALKAAVLEKTEKRDDILRNGLPLAPVAEADRPMTFEEMETVVCRWDGAQSSGGTQAAVLAPEIPLTVPPAKPCPAPFVHPAEIAASKTTDLKITLDHPFYPDKRRVFLVEKPADRRRSADEVRIKEMRRQARAADQAAWARRQSEAALTEASTESPAPVAEKQQAVDLAGFVSSLDTDQGDRPWRRTPAEICEEWDRLTEGMAFALPSEPAQPPVDPEPRRKTLKEIDAEWARLRDGTSFPSEPAQMQPPLRRMPTPYLGSTWGSVVEEPEDDIDVWYDYEYCEADKVEL